jgi:hypothetical protein
MSEASNSMAATRPADGRDELRCARGYRPARPVDRRHSSWPFMPPAELCRTVLEASRHPGDKSERMGAHYTRHVDSEANVIRAFNRVKDAS